MQRSKGSKLSACQEASVKIISGYHGTPWKEVRACCERGPCRLPTPLLEVLVDAAAHDLVT